MSTRPHDRFLIRAALFNGIWWIVPVWLFLMFIVVQWIAELIHRPGLEGLSLGLIRGIAALTPLAFGIFAFAQALNSGKNLMLHAGLALVFGLAATMTAHALIPAQQWNDAAIQLWPTSYLTLLRFPAHEPGEALRLLQWGAVCALEEILVLLLLWWGERRGAGEKPSLSASGEALEG